MSVTNQDIADQLAKIEERLVPYAESHEQLSVPPRMLLACVTLLNVALFVGGTIYTGVQVESIQKRYEEANIKILEARQKYLAADSKLKEIQKSSDSAEARLNAIQQQAEASLEAWKKQSRENVEAISSTRVEADNEFERLKTKSTTVSAAMSALQREAEMAVQDFKREFYGKLNEEADSTRAEVTKKWTDIDSQIATWRKEAKESIDAISGTKGKAEGELDSLKIHGKTLSEAMSARQKGAEGEIRALVASFGTTLDEQIRSNGDEMKKKQTGLDSQITGLSSKVDANAIDLAKVQSRLEEQLRVASQSNEEFLKKIKSIAKADKLTVPIAFSITDVWMKVLCGVFAVVALAGVALNFRRRYRGQTS